MQLNQDSVSDTYAVVNKKKIKPETDVVGSYCSITSSDEKYTDNTNLNDSNPANNYQTTPNTYAEVCKTMLDYNELYKTNNTKQRINRKPFLLTFLTILITAVVIITVAVVVELVVIVDLKSELDSVQNRNVGQNNLRKRLHQLQVDFLSFYSSTSDLLVSISQKTSENVSIWRQQANFTIKMIQNFGEKKSLLRITINVLIDTMNQQISRVENDTYFMLQNLKQEVSGRISNFTHNLHTTTKTLSEKLVRGIQTLHTFSSCATVFKLSIQLPPGKYMIQSGNSVRECYCINTCKGINGGWKRIAYLNTDENPVTCPDGFEVRSDTSNPPLCRRTDPIKGCSSVTYPTNSMSYSQVCGTVRVHPAGTPDGFNIFDDTSVNVDGVSLTYGDSSNGSHIWTYTAATTVGSNSRGCDKCNFRKPSFPGNNFTCTTAHCDNNCFPNTLWGNEALQCFGNETFYRQLSESTTDNIKMRVCRDQDRHDEDILISLVELFIK